MSESTSSAALPLDRAAADRMWAAYRDARPEAAAAGPEYTVEHFGDSVRLADELLDAVLTGPKRATSELVADFLARERAGVAADANYLETRTPFKKL